jgi:hypothetical protein
VPLQLGAAGDEDNVSDSRLNLGSGDDIILTTHASDEADALEKLRSEIAKHYEVGAAAC